MKRAAPVAELWSEHGEKVRYLVVGICNTAIGYLMFVVLLAVVGPVVHRLADSNVDVLWQIGKSYYLVVQWLTWVLAVPVSTTTMKYLAFRSRGYLPSEICRAYLVYLPAQGISSLILWITVAVAHLIPQVGQLAAIAVSTVFSYVGHKYFTFRTRAKAGE